MKLFKNTFGFLGKAKIYAFSHKIISVIILVILVGCGYWLYTIIFPGSTAAQYELAQVKNSSIVVSVSGTGQVSASNQVDLSAKASGKIIYLKAVSGQEVKEGELIAQIDSGTTGYELQNAQLSYQDSITSNQDDLKTAQDDLKKTQDDLDGSYIDGLATLTSVSSEMLDNIETLKNFFSGGYLTPGSYVSSDKTKEQIQKAKDSYWVAKKALDVFTDDLVSISAATSKDDIKKSLDKAYAVSLQISQTAKFTQDAIIYARDKEGSTNAQADEAYSEIVTILSAANSTASSINTALSLINSNLNNLSDAQITLKNLQAGQDSSDVRSKLLALKQKEESYEDYFIRAPFDGVIASVDIQKGNDISSGASVATVITKKKIAEISLNEVDAAKVKVGQKATVTFDAVEDLSLTGEVVEVNLVGTVSQGVVNYTIKVGFDSEDERIKPGMTATADIAIASAENVIVIPISAIKIRGDKSFVQIVNENIDPRNFKSVTLNSKPQSVEVTVGITNDDSSEITSGLSEGEVYIVKTVTTSTGTTKEAPGLFGAAGARTGTGTRAGNSSTATGR